MISFEKPSLLIQNVSSRPVKIFASVTIQPGATVDLFDKIDGDRLSDSVILRALAAPSGVLYIETDVKQRLRIVSISLPTSSTMDTEAALGTVNSRSVRRSVQIREDFLTDNFQGNTNWLAAGTGGAIVAAVGSGSTLANAAGVAGCQVAALNASAIFRLGVGAIPLGYGKTYVEFRFRAALTLPNGTDNWTVRVGLHNLGSGPGVPTACLGYYYDSTLSPNWIIESVFGGNTVRTITSIPVLAATWVTMRMDIDDAGNTAIFYFNDIQISTVDLSGVVKSELGVRYGPAVQLVKTLGTTARTVFLDYVWMDKDVAQVRFA